LKEHSKWINRFLLISKWLSVVLKGKRRQKREIKRQLKLQGDPLAQLKANFNMHQSKISNHHLRPTIFDMHNNNGDQNMQQSQAFANINNSNKQDLVRQHPVKVQNSNLTNIGGAMSTLVIQKPAEGGIEESMLKGMLK
jgi:hypothetical protein